MLRHGKAVEQGIHEELLKIHGGFYYGLVNAQALAVEADGGIQESPLENSKAMYTEQPDEDRQTSHALEVDPEYTQTGLLRSFGRLLFEQRHH